MIVDQIKFATVPRIIGQEGVISVVDDHDGSVSELAQRIYLLLEVVLENASVETWTVRESRCITAQYRRGSLRLRRKNDVMEAIQHFLSAGFCSVSNRCQMRRFWIYGDRRNGRRDVSILEILAELSHNVTNAIGQNIVRRANCQPNEVWGRVFCHDIALMYGSSALT